MSHFLVKLRLCWGTQICFGSVHWTKVAEKMEETGVACVLGFKGTICYVSSLLTAGTYLQYGPKPSKDGWKICTQEFYCKITQGLYHQASTPGEDTHFEIKPAFGAIFPWKLAGAKERCSYLCGMSNNVCISTSGCGPCTTSTWEQWWQASFVYNIQPFNWVRSLAF